jgi:hypothetical protein
LFQALHLVLIVFLGFNELFDILRDAFVAILGFASLSGTKLVGTLIYESLIVFLNRVIYSTHVQEVVFRRFGLFGIDG